MLAKSINQYAAINWASPLNRGLLRWWLWLPNRSGGKVWRDLTGKVPATMTGAVGVGALGRPGGHGAWHFDGVDDVASTANDDFSAINTITISMWHRVTAYNNNGDVALCRGSNVDQVGCIFIQPDNGSAVYGVGIRVSANYNSISFTRPAAGSWYHIVVCADRNAGAQQVTAVYINGRAQALTQTATFTNSTGGFHTGAWRFGSASASLYAPGQLDSCRCWNRQLSAAEALAVYHDERRGYPRSLRWVRDTKFYGEGSAPPDPYVPYSVPYHRRSLKAMAPIKNAGHAMSSLSSAVALTTIPGNALRARVVGVSGSATVYFREDEGTPSSSNGTPIGAGGYADIVGRNNLEGFRAIEASPSGTLWVEYFDSVE